MNLDGRREIYRVAFEAANSELTEISVEFDKLRSRKERIEQLVAVLKPLLAEWNESPVQVSAERSEQQGAEPAAETSTEGSGSPQPLVADPFQRRIDHVLGIGAGIRDVRKYSRQF